MKISVLSRSGKEIVKGGLTISDSGTVEDLRQAVFKYNKKWYPSRQRFTLPLEGSSKKPVVLESEKKLSDYFKPSDDARVFFKDLGPQVNYKTVFFWEYLGPMVLYALFYFFPKQLYPWSPGGRQTTHPAQTIAVAYWTFHYTKRILETYFIHRFSHGTMPIFNLFRNCGYYWTFGVFVGCFLNHPLYTPVPLTRTYIAIAFSVLCQLANLYCHVILRNLRPSNGKGGYQIPSGFLFNYITCANYTTEIFGWVGFNIATQTVAGYIFMLAGGYQMAMWAIAKHKRLRKTFDGKDGRPKYPRRWIMLPLVF